MLSCGKKKVDPVQEKEKQELQQLLNEKPMSESEIINEKLERLIRFSRENVETREELEKKINMEMSDFTEATKQKFYDFVDKDGAFSKNPRNVDTVIEIQNIEWDVTDDIRVKQLFLKSTTFCINLKTELDVKPLYYSDIVNA